MPEKNEVKTEEDTEQLSSIRKIWNFFKEILVIAVTVFFIHSFAYAQYEIWPSESMVPTLEVGDRIIVNKYAYGYSRHSLPLSRFFNKIQ